MAIALHHSQAKGAARLVLLGIANHDGDGGAWPSLATLSWYAGNLNRRTVQRALKELQDLGELGETRIMGGGTRDTPDWDRPNLYDFALSCPSNCDRTKNHRQCAECGHEDRRSKRFICTSCTSVDNPAGGGRSVHRPVVHRPRGGAVCAPPEPSIEPPSDESALRSTSPEAGNICWACGKPACRDYEKYCSHCSGNGLAQPWIDCTGDCGQIIKRSAPGMNTWTCPTCRQIDREETK